MKKDEVLHCIHERLTDESWSGNSWGRIEDIFQEAGSVSQNRKVQLFHDWDPEDIHLGLIAQRVAKYIDFTANCRWNKEYHVLLVIEGKCFKIMNASKGNVLHCRESSIWGVGHSQVGFHAGYFRRVLPGVFRKLYRCSCTNRTLKTSPQTPI